MDDVSIKIIEVAESYRRFLRTVVALHDAVKAKYAFQDLKRIMDAACESELKKP